MKLSRRTFFFSAGAAALAQASAAKPNIIFILADDLGIGGLSVYGGEQFDTPHLEALARAGTRFTNAYTAPLCGPSRALILTGRYAFRTGATNQDATGEMKGETFIPAVLKSAGYTSICLGKWGQLPGGPSESGFDEHAYFDGNGVYWKTQQKSTTYFVNGKTLALGDKEYMPDVIHAHLEDFIRRNRAKPFFAYYSMSHVHAEILPTPDSAPGSKDHYADNVRYMDKLVGKLMATLEQLGLRKNTLVIFTGDNGTGGNYADRAVLRGRRLAGEKGSMLEGGALVPLIVSWPGTTPAGKVSNLLTDSTDWLPTFAELAGAGLPKGKIIDGRSLAAQLRGKKGADREWIFIQLGRNWYVRERRFKLNQSGELFDMSKAPFEEPRAGTETEASRTARMRLQAALDQLNPAGGILDQGTGDGRHVKRSTRKKRRN